MSDPKASTAIVPSEIKLQDWVEAARNDPILYRDRQVTEIVLCAIGLTPSIGGTLVLKGGTLMAIAFMSDRTTADLDFTALVEPQGFEQRLIAELNPALERAARQLQYLDLICQVQRIEKKPRPEGFEDHDFPALHVHIASAERGSKQDAELQRGRAVRVLKLEITFRDQVYAFQELNLLGCGVAIQSFTLIELIAEKLRALLQQPIRNRYRRQDVYDIAFLLERFSMGLNEKVEIYQTLLEKCKSRNLHPKRKSISAPEVIARASADWGTLKQEIGTLPPFEERYAIVKAFYESLPWPSDK